MNIQTIHPIFAKRFQTGLRKCPCCEISQEEEQFDAIAYRTSFVNAVTAQFGTYVCIECLEDLVPCDGCPDIIKKDDVLHDDAFNNLCGDCYRGEF